MWHCDTTKKKSLSLNSLKVNVQGCASFFKGKKIPSDSCLKTEWILCVEKKVRLFTSLCSRTTPAHAQTRRDECSSLPRSLCTQSPKPTSPLLIHRWRSVNERETLQPTRLSCSVRRQNNGSHTRTTRMNTFVLNLHIWPVKTCCIHQFCIYDFLQCMKKMHLLFRPVWAMYRKYWMLCIILCCIWQCDITVGHLLKYCTSTCTALEYLEYFILQLHE